MTREEMNDKLKHLITCMKCKVSGKYCDENCPTQYDVGNMGEIIENLEKISKILEQETVPREHYEHEFFLRKELDFKVARLEKQIADQQPNDDCVSRKELLKLYGNRAFELQKTHQTDKQLGINWCINTLNELPPVAPTQRWIPVNERLPEEDEEYLLFGKVDEDEDNYIFIGEYDSCGEQFGIWQEQFDRTTLGCLGSEFYEYASVLAWMPLPQPYKAESEDKE